MARRIPKDCSVSEWSANPFVAANDEYSRIEEGYLNTELLIPISQNRRICHARHGLYVDWKYSRLFASSPFLEAMTGPLDEIADAVVFTGPGNHWHFNIDGLANLSAEIFERCKLVYVDHRLNVDQIEFLRTYVKSISTIDINVKKFNKENYILSNTIIPTNKPFDIKASRLKSCLNNMHASSQSAESHKRIYVTREGASTRRLLNEAELTAMLVSDFGFRSVRNEEFNLVEQMSRYRGAEVVMGPHGAGLTNVVYAEKPKALVELFHSYRQPFYAALSQALGIAYCGIEGDAQRSGDAHQSDDAPFTVDVEKVKRALGEVLGA